MPLMLYGAEIDDDKNEITIDNFANLIDPLSWEEFMPRGVTKEMFNKSHKTIIIQRKEKAYEQDSSKRALL